MALKVTRTQGGDELRVESGGKITAAGTQASAITDAPAGGTGATAGAYDTAGNRDLLIAKVNSILAALRNVGIIAP